MIVYKMKSIIKWIKKDGMSEALMEDLILALKVYSPINQLEYE